MFTHVRVGCSDVAKAKAFYDAALAPLGIEGRAMPNGGVAYSKGTGMSFNVGLPLEGEATYANGGTIGFPAPDQAAVDAFHAAGLANGGTSAGDPGIRERGVKLYAAYLRDPDGNKIVSLVRM